MSFESLRHPAVNVRILPGIQSPHLHFNLTGPHGYTTQGLGSYGGAEEEKPSCVRFTSEHGVNPNQRGVLYARVNPNPNQG